MMRMMWFIAIMFFLLIFVFLLVYFGYVEISSAQISMALLSTFGLVAFIGIYKYFSKRTTKKEKHSYYYNKAQKFWMKEHKESLTWTEGKTRRKIFPNPTVDGDSKDILAVVMKRNPSDSEQAGQDVIIYYSVGDDDVWDWDDNPSTDKINVDPFVGWSPFAKVEAKMHRKPEHEGKLEFSWGEEEKKLEEDEIKKLRGGK